MEIQRFDALARQLGRDGSRRRLLGLIGGTALGGLMAITSGPEAEAKKKKKKKSCKKKKCGECQTCRKGKCLAKPDGTVCSGGTCEGGVCRTVNNCPPDRVCEVAGICCGTNILCGSICRCEDNGELCSCAPGDTVCTGTERDSCCLPEDSCEPNGACVAETCTAQNAICTPHEAACGPTCLCMTTANDSQICGDLDGRTELCPENSECSNNTGCEAGEVCADVSCCDPGQGFIGICVPECAT